VCILSECFKISRIRREHRPSWFRESDHERVHRGASTRLSSEQCGATRERLGDLLNDVTCLEKAVREGVTTQVALQALDEYDGGHEWRPQVLSAERKDERKGSPRSFREMTDSTRIENQHDAQPAFRAGRRASRRARASARTRCAPAGGPTSSSTSAM